ncbi:MULTISPECIES: hypothetical protein [unclassified Clostridium]|uniref:hypothetical protein n=1 Tax=unclassified Clostridium TaxID=2614128 RepID=UPI000297CBB4|nr:MULTISPECIES: hypothetical protein [unclassified Clostridium]EKQ56431.1 MAG: hypothetical protein A370_01947 [Clostridium sp. Maddingley MBC34-26]
MFEFNREIINGSFNKVNKLGKEMDCVNINIKSRDKNLDVKFTGKGILVAGIAALVPALCVVSAITTALIVKEVISKRKKLENEEETMDI